MSVLAAPSWRVPGGGAHYRRARMLWAFVFVFVLTLVFAPADAVSQETDEDQDLVPAAREKINTKPVLVVPKGAPVTDEEAGAWSMPPMPWRAQLGLTRDERRGESGDMSGSFSKNLSGNASSYIWQPWFIGLNASLSLAQTETSSGQNKSTGDSLAGTVSANILPKTRFPATVTIGAGATENSSGSGSSKASFSQFAWSQRYAPESGGYTSQWQYGRNSFGSDGGGRSVTNTLNGTLGIRLESEAPQSLSFSTTLSDAKASATANGSEQGAINGAHSIYLEDYVMSISTTGLLSRNVQRVTDQQSSIDQVQLASSMDWVPSDDYPLRVSGGARFSQNQSKTKQGATQGALKLNTAGLDLAGSYPHDKNWSFSASSSVFSSFVETASEESNTTSFILNASTNWRGDGVDRRFGDWNYGVSYGAGLNAGYQQTSGGSGVAGMVSALSGSVGQNLTRGYSVAGYKVPVALTLTESIGASQPVSSLDGQISQGTQSVTHGAMLAWTQDSDGLSQMTFQAAFSDGRNFGASKSSFQSVNGGVIANQIVSAYQSLGGNANIFFSQQGEGGSAGAWKGSASAGVTYEHSRFADVTGLLYTVNYRTNLRETETVSNTSEKQRKFDMDHFITQSWSWRLGLLSWKVANDNAISPAGRLTTSVWLTVTRDFGGVL